MTAQELFQYLTQDAGFDEATTKVIMEQVAKNDKVASRAAGLKQQKEFEDLQRRSQELEQELNGDGAKPGTKAYAKWYQDNYPAIQKLQSDLKVYETRYGPLDSTAPKPQPTNDFSGMSKADLEAMIAAKAAESVQTVYGPQWSNLLKGSGKLLEKHLKSGRKTDIDWDKVSELAAKRGGDLIGAYDEWDAPEREKAQKEAEEKRIAAEVDKRVKAAKVADFFPAGADATPSSPGITSRSGDAKKTYDRSAVINAAMTGEYEGGRAN